MSKEEKNLMERLKGAEPPETPYPEPVPVSKTDAEDTYQMPGEVPVEKKKPSNKDDDKAAQADYFNRLKGGSKTDDTEEPDSEVVTDKTEPEPVKTEKPEEELPLPPTPIDNRGSDERFQAMEDKIGAMFKQISSINKSNEEKDEQIELLTQANSDLLLIDTQTLAEDLNDFKSTLLSIGTEAQDDEIEHILKNKGPDMAFKKSEAFRLDNKTSARDGINIVSAMMLLLNKFQEKFKYLVDA